MRLCNWTPLLLLGSLTLAAPAVGLPPLINEFMASNATTIADDDGDYSDWIELYNPGAAAFDLTGCYLSDDEDNPLRWQFPEGTVPPQGHLLVWASGKDRVSPRGDLHTDFAISAEGEPLLLTAPDGVTRLDEVGPVALETDVSFGRLPDAAGTWVRFGEATPGSANTGGLLHLAAPVVSHPPGFYTDAIYLGMSAADPEAVITYTLDGSEPTLASTVYDGPLILASRVGDPNVISLIPTNFRDPDHYAWRPPRGEVFKINVLRARVFRDGHAPSRTTTASYVIDPDLAGRIPLPVFSLATSAEHFFDDTIGIYVPGDTYVPGDNWTGNYFQTGVEWERPIHVEFFDLQGDLLLAQDAGVRIHGGWSRHFPQKALRLYARSRYGPSRFNCVLFPDLTDDSFNRVVLRNSGNDWGIYGFKDLMIQTVVADMGFDTQAGRPTIHFLNGEYWGIANLRERYDRHYLVRCYDVPENEVALLADNAEIEDGQATDRADYLALREYVLQSDMTLPESLTHVAERMDVENFIAYNVAEIFAANHDWPGNNVRYWRRTLPAYDPGAPPGHDGRWRWLMFDLDEGWHTPSRNTLALATASDSPGYPNPPWSTALLRGLLQNDWFRHAFITAFADHLNSTFRPHRLTGILDEFVQLYLPAIAAWHDRYDISFYWLPATYSLGVFAVERPTHVRQHIVDHFSLAGLTDLTLDVNDPALGAVQINQLLIDYSLAGLVDPTQPYPWHGIYFQGVPITITALPHPGYQLSGWLGQAGNDPELTLTPGADHIELTAVFARDLAAPIPLHHWHFNALPDGVLTAVAADLSRFGEGVLTYPGVGAGYLDRVNDGTALGALPDTPAGNALRVRNPSDTRELLITTPSPYHQDLTLSYAVKRTVNGAEEHSVHCQTTPDGTWHLVAEGILVDEGYQVVSHDLSVIDGIADNPDLVIRLTFGGENAGGTSGNQRFDNLILFGVQIPGANLPPSITHPVVLQHGIEGGEEIGLDVASIFADPEGDPLVFSAVSDRPEVLTVAVAGGQLTITPLLRGDALVTVAAEDGVNPPVPHTFRVLVHPAAAVLADGAYRFTAWDPDLPERTYPEHMLFLQSGVSDPGLDEPLLDPYFIAHDDYHADDQQTVGFPYNNTRRTRINGLGADGISFINTGRGRDLGGALLALDTRGASTVGVSWLGATVLPNTRIYAIRLQYRIGLEGPFQNLLKGGQPVEYLRNELAGDAEQFDPVVLPPGLLQQPYLQLLWRYYHLEGDSGPRAELRLDEIVASALEPTGVAGPAPPTVTALLGSAPNPFNPATEIRFSVKQGEDARLAIYNSRGQRVRSLGGFKTGFHRQLWDGTDDRGQRLASGVYFFRLQAASGAHTRKVLLLK